jgi:hypothetical protein
MAQVNGEHVDGQGRDLLDLIERVESTLANTTNDRMNEAVSALTAVVRAMILTPGPFWEKRDAKDSGS